MKGIILLTSGFEDTEAITTIDVLRRAGLEIDMVSVNNEDILLTQSGLYVKPEKLIKDIDYIFIYLLAICMSSLEERLFKSLQTF